MTAAELHGLPRPDRLRVLHLGLHTCNCSSTRKELAWLVDHARLDRLSGYLYCDLLSLPRVLPVEAGERLLGNLEARVGDAVLERTSETAELVDIRAIKTNLKRIRPPTRWHMRVSFPLFFFYRLLETACDAATELASPITFQHKADMSDNTTKSAEKSEDKPLREQIKAHHEKPTGQETNDETSQLTGPKKAGKEKSSMEENIAQFVNAEMGRPEKLSSRRELHQSQSVAHLASHGCSLLTSIVQTDRMYLTFSCITFCILIALFSTIC
ncbi:unnamed protein product [Protopolystoma xenopodis]|uniref:Uncharacterized protein n=1 Tax=Protopolystoma xenopodis TaxID=117903 RepID=A0A448XAS7_9PLAT|nr:unnamed protein product [Protopolystoma xenopodis]